MNRVILWCLTFGALSAHAMDAQLKSELERLRETYWEALVGPHWIHWDHRTSKGINAAVAPIAPTARLLQRVFGPADPAVNTVLEGLGELTSPSNMCPYQQRDHQQCLIKQYRRVDEFLRAANGQSAGVWRESLFGREIIRLSGQMLKHYSLLDGTTERLRKHLAEWQAEAQTLARLSPYPGLDEILNQAGIFVGSYIVGGTNSDYHGNMRITLDLMRAVTNELDAGWDTCERNLDGHLRLSRPSTKPAPSDVKRIGRSRG